MVHILSKTSTRGEEALSCVAGALQRRVFIFEPGEVGMECGVMLSMDIVRQLPFR